MPLPQHSTSIFVTPIPFMSNDVLRDGYPLVLMRFFLPLQVLLFVRDVLVGFPSQTEACRIFISAFLGILTPLLTAVTK